MALKYFILRGYISKYKAYICTNKKGIIFKIVALSPAKQGRWNLGFGDFDGVQINDAVMTNNHDAAKVMRN